MEEISEFDKLKDNLEIYEKKLLNKQFLIIFSNMENKKLKQMMKNNSKNLKELKAIEIIFKKENFPHLAGIKKSSYEKLKMSSKEFYDKLLVGEIEEKDCYFSTFRTLKNSVFTELPNIFRTISVLGDYDFHKEKLNIEKVIGNTKKIPEGVLGIVEDKKNKNYFDRYIPVSLLNAVIEDLILKNSQRRIIFILEKMSYEERYTKLLFKHKDFLLDNLYNNEQFFKCLSNDLKDKIRNDIGINIKEQKKIEINKKKELKPKENTEEKVKAVEKIKSKKEKPRREKRSRIRSKTKER